MKNLHHQVVGVVNLPHLNLPVQVPVVCPIQVLRDQVVHLQVAVGVSQVQVVHLNLPLRCRHPLQVRPVLDQAVVPHLVPVVCRRPAQVGQVLRVLDPVPVVPQVQVRDPAQVVARLQDQVLLRHPVAVVQVQVQVVRHPVVQVAVHVRVAVQVAVQAPVHDLVAL